MGLFEGANQGFTRGVGIGQKMYEDALAEKRMQAQMDRQAQMDAESRKQFDMNYKLKQEGLAAQREALANKGTGKPLPTTGINAQDLANFPTDLKSLKNLAPSIQQSADVVGPVAGPLNKIGSFLPEFMQPESVKRFKNLQADIDNVKQVIGKVKEGGVLRAEDEKKYERILASVKDNPENAIYKIGQIADEMASKYNATIDLLGKQGYKTAGLEKQDPGMGASDDFSAFWGD